MLRKGVPLVGKVMSSIFALAFVGLIVFATQAQRGLPGRKYTYVTAAFAELPPSLRKADAVRVQGVGKGVVSKIFFEDGHARVELQLPGDFVAYRDATARIRSRSLLGQRYVQIDPGTPAAGPLGDAVIPVERTGSTTELDQILDALDPPTRAALSSTLRELGGGIGGRGPDLADFLAAAPELLADLGTTSGALASEEADLAGLLRVADRLAGRFAGREATVERLVGQVATTLSALHADGALGESLKRLPATLDALAPAVSDLGSTAAALRPALSELRPGAAALGAATPDLRGTLREAPPVLRKIPGVAEPATPAVAGLTAALKDARPLAPALRHTLSSAASLLSTLAPYAPELNSLLSRLEEVFRDRDVRGNYWKVTLVNDPATQTPGAPPDVSRNPYPAPGQAAHDRRGR